MPQQTPAPTRATPLPEPAREYIRAFLVSLKLPRGERDQTRLRDLTGRALKEL